MFRLTTCEGVFDLADHLTAGAGLGGAIFLISYIVVRLAPPRSTF